MSSDISDFNEERECFFKNERYLVRNNGSVFRHTRDNRKPRPYDNFWTYGRLNKLSGYLEIASISIHQIVATAYHGVKPSQNHVVDHIDTNKQNNRAENLRWLTRLENIIYNPITAKRIAIVCGSVENFLNNPSKYKELFTENKWSWMRVVTEDEARICKENLLKWANSDKVISGGLIDDWIFRRKIIYQNNNQELDFLASLTTMAVQKNWKTPSEFFFCPENVSNESLKHYAESLKVGELLCLNKYWGSIILKFQLSNELDKIWVLCKSTDSESIKPWVLIKIYIENKFFVHEVICTYFEFKGAEKEYIYATEGYLLDRDSIDDYI